MIFESRAYYQGMIDLNILEKEPEEKLCHFYLHI